MSAQETAEGDETKLSWQVDALIQWRREIDTKIRAVLDKAMTALGMKSDRGPRDFDEERDRELKDMLFEAVRFGASQGGKGHGSINGNSKVVATLLAINIALTGAFSTWIVNTITKQGEAINDQSKDIVVIKCKIDPQCRLVVSGDKP